jgi:hypothetical protein
MLKMNAVGKAIASILFNPEKREEAFQKNTNLRKHLAAAETTIDYLERIVEEAEVEKFRHRVNPGLLYDELKIEKLGLKQRGYVCVFQAILSCPGLNLGIDDGRGKGGNRIYRFDLGPYVISHLKKRMGMYEQTQQAAV